MDELSEEPVVLRFGRAEALVLLEWYYNELDPDQVGVSDDPAFAIALHYLHNVLDEAVEAEQITNLWEEARSRVIANDPFRPGGPRNP